LLRKLLAVKRKGIAKEKSGVAGAELFDRRERRKRGRIKGDAEESKGMQFKSTLVERAMIVRRAGRRFSVAQCLFVTGRDIYASQARHKRQAFQLFEAVREFRY
jgi:hypothetical protein